jgi:hypothetical protein
MNPCLPAGSLLAIVATLPLPVQGPSERQLMLPPADARLSAAFGSIGSVRELSDGRVLITDSRDGRIVAADLGTGAVEQVGRRGQGPHEYGTVGPLLPLAGDSSLMVDVLSRRWLLFSGSSLVATLPPDIPIIKAVKTFAKGADGLGHVWASVSPREFVQETAKAGSIDFGPADSDIVVRGNRATGKLDTVTRVRGAVSRRTVTANAYGRFHGVTWSHAPLSAVESAALFSDGWFAVARVEPYRVDWIAPDGRVRRGRPIPVTPIKVTAPEKEAYFARVAASRATGAETAALPDAMKREIDALRDRFPAVFPPFTGAPIAGADGNLWLRRPVSKRFPNLRYDVVDRRGQRIGIVSLARGERVVTVSRTAVYVAWKDQDGIERLRRHPGAWQ